VLCTQHVRLARQAGALTVLPIALRSRIFVHVFWGELDEGAALTRRGARGHRSDRDPARGLRRRRARRLARSRGRGHRADQAPHRRRGRAAARAWGWHQPLRGRVALQRPRPLRGGHWPRPSRHASTTIWASCVGADGADRGGARSGKPRSRPPPLSGSRRRRAPPAPTGRSASRRARGAAERGRRRGGSTARRSSGSAAPASASSSPALTCSTASGCAARPSRGRARAAAYRPRDAHRDGYRGVRRARPP
jgi:hypothetical protein